MTEVARPTLGAETKRFAVSAFVYLVPGLLARGISFFLTPIYTRAMEPADFGIVAVANTVTTVLGLLLGFSLHACIPRLVHEYDPDDQRKLFGSLLAFSLVVPTLIVGCLFAVGAYGGLDFFRAVPFRPYLQLAVGSSLFSVYSALPLSIYAAREQPGRVAVLSLATALSQLGAAIVFVAVLRQGALGVLRANVLSNGFVGLLSIVLTLRMSRFSPALTGLRPALAFGLPLLPHLISNWVLSISDRLILERYVPSSEVGSYSLAYIFCLLVGLVASSVTSALAPMANRQLKQPDLARNVPPLGTYALLIIVACALATALASREVVAVMAPPSYAGATVIVPWVVLGAVFQGVYLIVSIGTWYSMKTRLVPVITGLAAALNVAINLVFVPRFGFIAAGVATAICYAVSAVLHAVLAHFRHRIAWEYSRWARLFLAASLTYVAGLAFSPATLAAALVWKTFLLLVVFPLGLLFTRFFSRQEIARARAALSFRRASL